MKSSGTPVPLSSAARAFEVRSVRPIFTNPRITGLIMMYTNPELIDAGSKRSMVRTVAARSDAVTSCAAGAVGRNWGRWCRPRIASARYQFFKRAARTRQPTIWWSRHCNDRALSPRSRPAKCALGLSLPQMAAVGAFDLVLSIRLERAEVSRRLCTGRSAVRSGRRRVSRKRFLHCSCRVGLRRFQ